MNVLKDDSIPNDHICLIQCKFKLVTSVNGNLNKFKKYNLHTLMAKTLALVLIRANDLINQH